MYGSILLVRFSTSPRSQRREILAWRDLLDPKDRRESPVFPELTELTVLTVLMVPTVKTVTMDCLDKMEPPELREPKERPAPLEMMVPRDPKESVESPDKRDLLESRDRRDNREMMELKESVDLRECVNQMTTILATVTPTLSSDTHSLLRPQNAPLTTNLSGPDILLSSLRATAMDSHRILAVLDLAWRNSS